MPPAVALGVSAPDQAQLSANDASPLRAERSIHKAAEMSRGGDGAYDALQKKIYTRWVNQKLGSRMFPPMSGEISSVDGIGADANLSNLVAALSEKQMPTKMPKRIVKAQKLDWIDKQLKFVWGCGVEMKLKPAPENVYEGDFVEVMGLVWSIMLKFLKFDDDDGEVAGNAKDALLRWCQFHTKGVANVKVSNLTKSWQDGLALCALVEKFAPGTIDVAGLDPANAVTNIQTAMDVAEKLFKVTQFLKPADILSLTKAPDGEKSMLIFISEYYYGINDWFKRKLAGTRISKVVVFTRENDERRVSYTSTAEQLQGRLAAADQLLADVASVDNTMSGAVQRLASFVDYKTNVKSQIMTLFLELIGNYDTLQLRLLNNTRPPFAPAPGSTPDELKGRIAAITGKEAVEPKLYAELNRQHKLVALHARHTAEAEKLKSWTAREGGALKEPIVCENSGDARKQLKQFGSFKRAFAGKQSDTFAALTALSTKLSGELYESVAVAQEDEAVIQAGFSDVETQATINEPILEDNLARELYKEALSLKVDVHADINDNLMSWGSKKTMYFKVKEEISSVQEARLQLSVLDSADRELQDVRGGNFARLQELGDEIRTAKWQTALSEWVYPTPDSVSALEHAMEESFAELASLSFNKRTVLDDDLAREKMKEQIKLLVGTHAGKQEAALRWAEKKHEYLDTKEEVSSSASATFHLAVLEAYEKERESFVASEVALLNEMGAKIRDTRYETEHSRWQYEDPEEISRLEAEVAADLSDLAGVSAAKKATLDDDLARELYAEETRLIAGQHVDTALGCARWANDKAAYLQTDVLVHSIREAQVASSVLEAYVLEKRRFTDTGLASLKAIGAAVLAREHKTDFSQYTYESPDEITEREAEVDDHWVKLDQLAEARMQTLAELLKRETRKEELRVEFADLAGEFVAYCNDQIAVIGQAEDQKTMFGTSIEEVKAFDQALATLDAEIDHGADMKQVLVDNSVREMAQLVRATSEFDKAQAASHAADAAVEEEDASEAGPSTIEVAKPSSKAGVRRSRFGTLSKSLKKAFGRSKKKTSQLEMLADARRKSMDAGDQAWPEDSNPYTMLSVAVLRQKRAGFEAAQAARREHFASELARWEMNDAACKEFAAVIDPMHASVEAMLGMMMSDGSASEEAQLEAVTKVVGDLQGECFKLPNAHKLAADLESRGVATNPYSTNSVTLVEGELENVQLVAEKKRPHLVAMIEYKQYKGISPEQYAEMETLFKEYDADNSNSISAKELRSCLFSLGEERSKTEIAKYMETFAKGNKGLNFEQFRDLMMQLIGDMGTSDGLVESLGMLAKGRPFITIDPQMAECISDGLLLAADVDFFAQEAPTSETEEGVAAGGRDYAAWVAAVCSR